MCQYWTSRMFCKEVVGTANALAGGQGAIKVPFDPDVGWDSVAGWNREIDRSTVLPHFEDWVWDWLDVPAFAAGAEKMWEFPMVDRDPAPTWLDGRMALVGDAAHVMYPVGSNGASQAILDARALADLLANGEHPMAALLYYEKKRLAPTAAIVAANRKGGPEGVIDFVEARAPDGYEDVHDVATAEELRAIVGDYEVLAGFAAPGR